MPRVRRDPRHPSMRRHRHFLAPVSLALCLATVALWAHSYRRATDWSFRVGSHVWAAHSSGGHISLGHCRAVGPTGNSAAPPARWRWDIASVREPDWVPGFGWGDVRVGRAMPMLGDLPGIGQLFTVD